MKIAIPVDEKTMETSVCASTGGFIATCKVTVAWSEGVLTLDKEYLLLDKTKGKGVK